MTITLNGSEGITLNNGSADGAQVTLSSSGYSNWNLDNYSGRLRAYYGATEYFTINTSGNVGIGTSSPLAPLHIQGSATGAVQAFIKNSNGATGSSAELVFGNWSGSIPSGTGNPGPQARIAAINLNSGNAATALAFSTYSGATVTEAMRIDSSGNVGIGTSSPTSKLGIQGSSGQNAYIECGGNGNTLGGASALFGQNDSSIAYCWNRANAALLFGTNGTERARIDSSGQMWTTNGAGSVAKAYDCRAWVNFNGTGTVAIRASGNVSSITDNGTGNYTVNFSTAMPDTSYAPTHTLSYNLSSADVNTNVDIEPYSFGTSAFSLLCGNQSGVLLDMQVVSLAFFR